MDKRYLGLLAKRFPTLTRREIEQTVLLAEWKVGDNGPLVWRVATNALLDQIRRCQRYLGRMVSFEWLFGDNYLVERYREEEEWRHILYGLPLPARQLARLARQEAERFEDVPDGIWRQHNLSELRRRIKREYIAWDKNHSERSYFRARAILVKALRRHKHKTLKISS